MIEGGGGGGIVWSVWSSDRKMSAAMHCTSLHRFKRKTSLTRSRIKRRPSSVLGAERKRNGDPISQRAEGSRRRRRRTRRPLLLLPTMAIAPPVDNGSFHRSHSLTISIATTSSALRLVASRRTSVSINCVVCRTTEISTMSDARPSFRLTFTAATIFVHTRASLSLPLSFVGQQPFLSLFSFPIHG